MEPPARPVNAARRALPAVLLALLVGACALFETPPERRGHRVDAEDLAQLVPGTSTRADVLALLGSPSATGTFDAENWYYISATTRALPGRASSVEDQRVVAIRFDSAGRVAEVRTLGPEDARPVEMVARTTPTPGTERTVLQQLFGNLGRLAPGAPAGAQRN